MNPGYSPARPTTNPAAPPWFSPQGIQAICDGQYQHGSDSLDHYYAVCEAWVSENIRLRDLSTDPEHYTPTAAPRIPRREIYDWDSDAQAPCSRWQTDPAIPAPALPPYVKVAPVPTGFVSTAAQAQANSDAMNATAMKMLSDILGAVNAIRMKVGA